MALTQSLNVAMGTPAIDFSLPGTDGKAYSLHDFASAKVLVVIFMCNHCPYVLPKLPRFVEIQKDFGPRGVQLAGINANDEVNYPTDSFDNMKKLVEEHGINFPYLRDESQMIASKYQAQCTPDIYVFDSERRLAYHGRIDELGDAIEALLTGKKPSMEQHPSEGCNVKWKKE